MKRTLQKIECKYGAPMGRRNYIPTDINTVGKLHLEKLQWIDGDYDYGGAYWGCGGRGQNIYWAYGDTNAEQVDVFVRAVGRNQAKEMVREIIANAKFYR